MPPAAPPEQWIRIHAPEAAPQFESARLELVAEIDAHEGPVHDPGHDALYVTSVPRPGDAGPAVRLLRLALGHGPWPLSAEAIETVAVTAAANGMALGPEGRLIVCEQGGWRAPACISAIDPRTGLRDVLVDSWRGLPLNSPNDVVVSRDGSIWFTDPTYGYLQGFRPEPRLGPYVYRYVLEARHLDVVADGLCQPNGIAFSPDESVLYVGDSGAVRAPGDYDPRRPHCVRAHAVEGGRLGPSRLLAVVAPGYPDGIVVDTAGRVFATCEDGIQVFDPSGRLLAELLVPGAVNMTFGERDGTALFVTADEAVWAVVLETPAAPEDGRADATVTGG